MADYEIEFEFECSIDNGNNIEKLLQMRLSRVF